VAVTSAGGEAVLHPQTHLSQSEQIRRALSSFNLEALAQAILQQHKPHQSPAAAAAAAAPPPNAETSPDVASVTAESLRAGGPSIGGKVADLITDEELQELGVSLAGQSASKLVREVQIQTYCIIGNRPGRDVPHECTPKFWIL
jgi:hypothetical protein